MRAVQLTAVNQMTVTEVPDPQPAAGEVIVAVKAAALNHRDVWIKSGLYAGLKWPCLPGSDGAGHVVALGEGVESGWLGQEVIINPCFNWGDREDAQAPDFSILGLPRPGTLAEKVAVPVAQLERKPAHLTWQEAGAGERDRRWGGDAGIAVCRGGGRASVGDLEFAG
jgi:NADPH:quinone reductase-like Zn-dependent oxidoreductase